ncbi:MAG: hypothetical protein IJU70_04600 [Lentisphaeria bacterium]|nr:hypothetical protein [Lentisphaeria bacterium]
MNFGIGGPRSVTAPEGRLLRIVVPAVVIVRVSVVGPGLFIDGDNAPGSAGGAAVRRIHGGESSE